MVADDNQRPVAATYPYYVGTSDDFYDPGYRAGNAYATLDQAVASGSASAGTIAALQNNLTDSLAQQMVPQLLGALKTTSLTPTEKSAASLLTSWNDSMSAGLGGGDRVVAVLVGLPGGGVRPLVEGGPRPGRKKTGWACWTART